MQYGRASLLTLALLATVAACDNSTGITEADIACPPGSTMTYANFGQQVIADNCLDCHTTRERPFLDTQARVQMATESIIHEAVFSSSMPEDGSMTNELRTQLGQWLRCGAP